MLRPAPVEAPAIDHYENFPVASWLCPPALRPAVAALYHYARTADDLADEGSASTEQRLADLQAYRADVLALRAGQDLSSPWAATIGALAPHIERHGLDWADLLALLDAFVQDVQFSAQARRYATMDELLHYCARSANPVGHLMLRIMGGARGLSEAQARGLSDDICTALQLINFWQDLSVDVPRGRHYIPRSVWRAHGLPEDALPAQVGEGRMRAIVRDLVDDALARMQRGQHLARHVPGRMGWELRAVVQGGRRIAERIAEIDHTSWRQRPVVRRRDLARIAWRCWTM
jgi:squalene synthase HpnC